MNYFIKEYKMGMFDEYIEETILDRYGFDFEEGLSKNVEFEFETSEYNCHFIGSIYVEYYNYDSGSYYDPPDESAVVKVSGELLYSTKDFDDENEKTEDVNFEIAY